MSLESYVERVLVQEVRKAGGHCWKLMANPAGVPDRLVILPGARFFAVELKQERPQGKLSAIQRALHARVLRDTGIEVVTLYGSEEVRAWVRGA